MTRFVGHDLGLEEASAQTEVAHDVQEFVPSALIREMKCHIGEVQASVWADSTLEECMKRGVFIM